MFLATLKMDKEAKQLIFWYRVFLRPNGNPDATLFFATIHYLDLSSGCPAAFNCNNTNVTGS